MAGHESSGPYMTLLPDGDRRIVSAGGYILLLDPETGEERWHNPLTGFGIGVAALATIRSHSPHGDAASQRRRSRRPQRRPS